MLGRQFDPPKGDEKSRKKLLKQLRKDFPPDALAWIESPDIQVEGPTRIPSANVDWDDYPEWRASKQLKAVVKVAKKLDKKSEKGKPSVMAKRPGDDDLLIIDGHHHTIARVDHKEDPLAYVIHVPRRNGPWDTLHDRQDHDAKKDDFGPTPEGDRDH